MTPVDALVKKLERMIEGRAPGHQVVLPAIELKMLLQSYTILREDARGRDKQQEPAGEKRHG